MWNDTGDPTWNAGRGSILTDQQSEDHPGPGAAMLDEKLFVVTETGNLWERHWRSDLERGRVVRSRPTRQSEDHPGPGAAMLDEKLFVVPETGNR